MFSYLFGIPWDTDYRLMPYRLWAAYRRLADMWSAGELRAR